MKTELDCTAQPLHFRVQINCWLSWLFVAYEYTPALLVSDARVHSQATSTALIFQVCPVYKSDCELCCTLSFFDFERQPVHTVQQGIHS